MSDGTLEKLKDAVINFDEETAESLIDEAIEKEMPAKEILSNVSAALETVGEKYENHEYFLTELIMCGDVAKNIIQKSTALIEKSEKESEGEIILATVKGDIHDIGKTIVGSFLAGAGFKVHDIGVEVDATTFAAKIRENKPDIIAMSALLSTTAPYMETVVNHLKEEGLRNKVKIIVGGRPVTDEYAQKIGADGTAVNPSDAVSICKQWVS